MEFKLSQARRTLKAKKRPQNRARASKALTAESVYIVIVIVHARAWGIKVTTGQINLRVPQRA